MIKLIDLIKTDDMERTKIKFHKNEGILIDKPMICFLMSLIHGLE